MTSAAVRAETRAQPIVRRKRRRPSRLVLHVFLFVTALIWLVPIGWALFTSFRSYTDTAIHGYVSIPHGLTLDNYRTAWDQADLPHYFLQA